MKQSDERKIKVVLRAFSLDKIDIDFATKTILDIYKFSERFNNYNFCLGAVVGATAMLIIAILTINN